jgi:hypothetical protein
MKQAATLIRARLKTPRAAATGFTPRWIAFPGFTLALLLLFSGRYIDWIILVFPLWVLLISIYILIDNLRSPSQTAATNPGQTNP